LKFSNNFIIIIYILKTKVLYLLKYIYIMLLSKWDVVAETEQCVLVTIDEDVDLTNLELTIIDEFRIPVIKLKVNTRDISICLQTGKPMFAQLGNSVKYITGSGKNSY